MWFVGKYITMIYEMEICLIGKPSSDTTAKPKRAPKQKKVEPINSDSDSEFGIPKKTTPPKGEDYVNLMCAMWKRVSSTH